ncbi:hypothetical protein MNBD_BACTEROID03-153 [hydrothermal vent metagenome]|uniref:Uncharacterized protein n=1 Tax=hydrothermal vent metagenome TaxID=652676 RepID=A0A3B0TNM3_9ZZZZ
MKMFLLGIVVLVLSCNGQKKASMVEDKEDNSTQSDSLVLLVRDSYSGSDLSETLIITNSKALKFFFSQVNKTRKPGIQVPEVDFSKEVVIIHCSGKQGSAALPMLTLLKETDTTLVLGSRFEINKKTNSATVVTSPFCVYKMPLTTKRISVEKGLE